MILLMMQPQKLLIKLEELAYEWFKGTKGRRGFHTTGDVLNSSRKAGFKTGKALKNLLNRMSNKAIEDPYELNVGGRGVTYSE